MQKSMVTITIMDDLSLIYIANRFDRLLTQQKKNTVLTMIGQQLLLL